MIKRKVILLDDDLSCLDLMQIMLNELDFETFPFTQWESRTIQDIITIQPDLIILDEVLIGLKGSEICMILKSVNQLRTVPIVIASHCDELAVTAKKAFADGYIQKPYNMAEMEKLVRWFEKSVKQEK